MKVLIADDKSASRELLRTLLEQGKHTVLEAENGLDAVRVASENLPDLIVLDLHMPLLDGFGVLAELKRDSRFRNTPIAAMTASAMKGDEARALRLGFAAYITKPIGLASLRREMEQLLVS